MKPTNKEEALKTLALLTERINNMTDNEFLHMEYNFKSECLEVPLSRYDLNSDGYKKYISGQSEFTLTITLISSLK